MNQHAEPAPPEDPNFHNKVIAYLLKNPNFFERYPETLIALQVPHLVRGAASLIERQVRVLRKELETERALLDHVIARAREYDALVNRLHGFSLKVIGTNDPVELCRVMNECLSREFHADAVVLKLFPLVLAEDAPADDTKANAGHTLFHAFIKKEHAFCGALPEAQGTLLFGARNANIRTAALIPIHTDAAFGVLAIGSIDPERFHPDMATDLLDRLGEIVSQKLRVLPPVLCDDA
ncbi:hypothetical protein CKO12_01890 [Chromatium okenii]|uniref:DUF484 family protein n=1 Tax=Chromatium okenii TaxID=61644 RepID=UPI0019067DCC|nr:DUF484 family protein [Chromatium okenii]MBK1640649.1 hypothetical protein [Chromatium okenii]